MWTRMRASYTGTPLTSVTVKPIAQGPASPSITGTWCGSGVCWACASMKQRRIAAARRINLQERAIMFINPRHIRLHHGQGQDQKQKPPALRLAAVETYL